VRPALKGMCALSWVGEKSVRELPGRSVEEQVRKGTRGQMTAKWGHGRFCGAPGLAGVQQPCWWVCFSRHQPRYVDGEGRKNYGLNQRSEVGEEGRRSAVCLVSGDKIGHRASQGRRATIRKNNGMQERQTEAGGRCRSRWDADYGGARRGGSASIGLAPCTTAGCQQLATTIGTHSFKLHLQQVL
jgi:hypothetical protein